ncbi:MAG: cob(I)yrinic acid a,c-diamide adenosyltransferase [Hymenobacter sp.]
MKIYTKTGDSGDTSLFDGTRVRKTDPRVVAYGDVDELQACLGVARAASFRRELDDMCLSLQRDLFALGARLADPSHKIARRVEKIVINDTSVARLEGWIDQLDTELPPLRHFILSDGCPGGAFLHLARTVCRRAEQFRPAARPGRRRAGRRHLRQPPVRPVVHDGEGGQPSRHLPRDTLVAVACR